jgi:hypothetical protein
MNTNRKPAAAKKPADLVLMSVPGRNEEDSATWYVYDRAGHCQVGPEHTSSGAARAALTALRGR